MQNYTTQQLQIIEEHQEYQEPIVYKFLTNNNGVAIYEDGFVLEFDSQSQEIYSARQLNKLELEELLMDHKKINEAFQTPLKVAKAYKK